MTQHKQQTKTDRQFAYSTDQQQTTNNKHFGYPSTSLRAGAQCRQQTTNNQQQTTNNKPNFSHYGYEIISELGRNREGGRITWLAMSLTAGTRVVLKQFCFATIGSSWSGFNAYEREIKVLQELDFPGIPHYLGSFPTEDGFCLIQEYKSAPSLGKKRTFAPEEIKTIALGVLTILDYLQKRIPAVIHRDITPDNILVDKELNVYLIDFGLARIGSNSISGSSAFKGTPGFIPPEQVRRPTLASDLYGLGATIICLLVGIKSREIQDLTAPDDPYKIEFKSLAPSLSLSFLGWLEKMVQPKLKDRFANAREALEALEYIDIIRQPEVKLSKSYLNVEAEVLGEKITRNIWVNNLMEETILESSWSVAPHGSDPPHTPEGHAWISFRPRKIIGNQAKCKITIDTAKLMAGRVYEREILFASNGLPSCSKLKLKVRTAELSITTVNRSSLKIGTIVLLLVPSTIAWLGSAAVAMVIVGAASTWEVVLVVTLSWAVAIAWSGSAAVTWTLAVVEAGAAGVYLAVGATVVGAMMGANTVGSQWAVVGAGIVAGLGAVTVIRWLASNLQSRGFSPQVTWASLLLAIAFALTLGIGFSTGFFHSYILLALGVIGLPLGTMLLYPHWQKARLIARYRKLEKQHLIKP